PASNHQLPHQLANTYSNPHPSTRLCFRRHNGSLRSPEELGSRRRLYYSAYIIPTYATSSGVRACFLDFLSNPTSPDRYCASCCCHRHFNSVGLGISRRRRIRRRRRPPRRKYQWWRLQRGGVYLGGGVDIEPSLSGLRRRHHTTGATRTLDNDSAFRKPKIQIFLHSKNSYQRTTIAGTYNMQRYNSFSPSSQPPPSTFSSPGPTTSSSASPLHPPHIISRSSVSPFSSTLTTSTTTADQMSGLFGGHTAYAIHPPARLYSPSPAPSLPPISDPPLHTPQQQPQPSSAPASASASASSNPNTQHHAELDNYIREVIREKKSKPKKRTDLITMLQSMPVKPPYKYRRAVVVQRAVELLETDPVGESLGLELKIEGKIAAHMKEVYGKGFASENTTPTGTPRLSGTGAGEGGVRTTYFQVGIPRGMKRWSSISSSNTSSSSFSSQMAHGHGSTSGGQKYLHDRPPPPPPHQHQKQQQSRRQLSPRSPSVSTTQTTASSTHFNPATTSLTLPYKLQYNILAPLLHVLESSCYTYASSHPILSHQLHSRGWDSGECAPFTEWLHVLGLDDEATLAPLGPVKESVEKRCKLTSEAIIKALETVESVAVKLGDQKLARDVAALRACMVKAVDAVRAVVAEERVREIREVEEARRRWEEVRRRAEERRGRVVGQVVGSEVEELEKVVGKWRGAGSSGAGVGKMVVGSSEEEEEDDVEMEEEEDDGDEMYYDTDDKMDGT
ncbi:hypothetical protein EX30DRAFT_386784, partial [Ascodesmis nigricans]